MATALTARERHGLAALIVIAIVVRLATLGAYPLMDPTEARYAEMARKMLETGQWLMPQADYGVPFWGKPPLSMWWSAASMAVFGVNEFAARLPSVLAVFLSGLLIYVLARLRGGRDHALWAAALFASTGFVFVAAGAVMTDPALLLGTTLSMAGYWAALEGPPRARPAAPYAFFAGLTLGLLAKGPVAAVLIFVPIIGYLLTTRSVRKAWRALPWITGGALSAAATAVWYWAAERASPGFLEYFILGEHWKRFVEPGWSGDLYGVTHSRPHGTIWLFWIAAALPWSIVAIVALAQAIARRRYRRGALVEHPWRVYLLLWAVAPMLFFTLAGNVLIAYVLPGLPAFVLLLADLWKPDAAVASPSMRQRMRLPVRQVLIAGTVVPAILIAVVAGMHRSFETSRSQKALIRDYERTRPLPQTQLVYFRGHPSSADFYSQGTAVKTATLQALEPYLDADGPRFFAVTAQDLKAMPAVDRSKLQLVGNYGEYRLLQRALPTGIPDAVAAEGPVGGD